MADLSKERLVLEIILYFVLLFAHGAFIEEFVRLLLKGFDVVLVKQLGPV